MISKHSCPVCVCVCVLGLIHVGDELKEVNGIPVDDKKPEEIIRILVSLNLLFESCPCLEPEFSLTAE